MLRTVHWLGNRGSEEGEITPSRNNKDGLGAVPQSGHAKTTLRPTTHLLPGHQRLLLTLIYARPQFGPRGRAAMAAMGEKATEQALKHVGFAVGPSSTRETRVKSCCPAHDAPPLVAP